MDWVLTTPLIWAILALLTFWNEKKFKSKENLTDERKPTDVNHDLQTNIIQQLIFVTDLIYFYPPLGYQVSAT